MEGFRYEEVFCFGFIQCFNFNFYRVQQKGDNTPRSNGNLWRNYQVIEIDKSNFLIKWENASLIFNNNECIQVVKIK